MRILVVNPNTTESMTARIGAAARRAAGGNTDVTAVNPAHGPVSIEGYFDEAFAAPGLVEEIVKGEAQGAEGFVIACFDDTGLEAARVAVAGPVVGVGEAGFHLASLVAHRFSVVTTLSRSIAPIETNLMKYGLGQRCARVRACEVPVLELENEGSDACDRLSAEIGRALREDEVEAIVLGCAGMTDLAAALAREHGVPVIDGVAAAVKLVESLVALGLKTGKRGPFAPSPPKPFKGAFAAMGSM
jgi:allantoin racemase